MSRGFGRENTSSVNSMNSMNSMNNISMNNMNSMNSMNSMNGVNSMNSANKPTNEVTSNWKSRFPLSSSSTSTSTSTPTSATTTTTTSDRPMQAMEQNKLSPLNLRPNTSPQFASSLSQSSSPSSSATSSPSNFMKMPNTQSSRPMTSFPQQRVTDQNVHLVPSEPFDIQNTKCSNPSDSLQDISSNGYSMTEKEIVDIHQIEQGDLFAKAFFSLFSLFSLFLFFLFFSFFSFLFLF